MINLNDDLLNKYIDGDLNEETLKKVELLIESSEENRLKYNHLLYIHRQLKKLEPETVSYNFTPVLMKSILKREKSLKEQTIFMYSIGSVFALFILIVIGVLIAVLLNTSGSSKPAELKYLTDTIAVTGKNIGQLLKSFSEINISVIGSALSLFILFSAYFFFDSIKQVRERLKKIN